MFSREDTVLYAKKWWNKRNPSFYNFDAMGGDCTNFVSQCLYYGGISMNTKQYGWFYYSLNHRSPSWSGVDEFFNFATSNISNSGVVAKLSNINDVEIADVFIVLHRDDPANGAGVQLFFDFTEERGIPQHVAHHHAQVLFPRLFLDGQRFFRNGRDGLFQKQMIYIYMCR